ncbi:HTH-type transcriptional repressor YcgE [compost metagenome]
MNNQPDTHAQDCSAGYQQALAEGWLPIRDVARVTGVNAITLRAWERRYGLIVPQRSPKGHRLFSADHVQRIHTIVTWLNRGVAVSQVKPLLDTPQAFSTAVESEWKILRQKLTLAISQLAEREVDDLINQAMSLYPPRTLCEQLLMPLLGELEQRWQGQFGARMEQRFFHGWLRSKLGARLYHNNRQLRGAPLLLINHSDLPLEPQLWLAAWLISSTDCPVEVFDGPLPAGELALAVEHLQARAVLLYSSTSINLKQLTKLLHNVSCPTLIAGPTVCIHHTELSVSTTDCTDLLLAKDPLAAHQMLLARGLI